MVRSSYSLAELAQVKTRTAVDRMSGIVSCAPKLSPNRMGNGDAIQNFFIKDPANTEIKAGVWNRPSHPFPTDMRDYDRGFIELVSKGEGGLLWLPAGADGKFKLEVNPALVEVKLLKPGEVRDGIPRSVNAPAAARTGTNPCPAGETLLFPKQDPGHPPRQSRLSLAKLVALQRQCLEQSIEMVSEVQAAAAKKREALGVAALALVEVNFNPLVVTTYELMVQGMLASGQPLGAEEEPAEVPSAKQATAIERLGAIIGHKEKEATKLLCLLGALPDGASWRTVKEEEAQRVLAEGRFERAMAS